MMCVWVREVFEAQGTSGVKMSNNRNRKIIKSWGLIIPWRFWFRGEGSSHGEVKQLAFGHPGWLLAEQLLESKASTHISGFPWYFVPGNNSNMLIVYAVFICNATNHSHCDFNSSDLFFSVFLGHLRTLNKRQAGNVFQWAKRRLGTQDWNDDSCLSPHDPSEDVWNLCARMFTSVISG